MNRYPLWKYLMLAIVLAVGVLYALPNLYGDDPAVLLAPAKGDLPEATERRVNAALTRAGVEALEVEPAEEGAKLLIRLKNKEDQLKTSDALKRTLGRDYRVALNLAPRTPDWLQGLNGTPMTLGLDLRGGIHIVLQVDVDVAVQKAQERYENDVPRFLRRKKLRSRRAIINRDGFILPFKDEATRDGALEALNKEYRELDIAVIDEGTGSGDKVYPSLKVSIPEEEIDRIKEFALKQNLTTIRNRVNEMGVAEPVVQRQGKDRIVVQLPGVSNNDELNDILSATATLEYRPVLPDQDEPRQAAIAGQTGHAPPGTELYKRRGGGWILLQKEVIATGDQLTDASSGFDQDSGSPAVFVTLDGSASKRMLDFTTKNVGNRMAVVFREVRTYTDYDKDGNEIKSKEKIEEVISDAVVREPFGRRFQTTGLDSSEEAHNTALLLRAGALAAPVEIVEERSIGPSLGQDNIDQGTRAVLIGFLLVVFFMAIYYRVFGLIADVALMVNLVLIVSALSMLGATLTLPGIAGIVLTVGMAVDANVLIFERIREEINAGASPQNAINGGYDKAFLTIMDANVTTLIAALVLFLFGTGPIKGFAVTLSIGIVTSMFTAIVGTRALVNLVYGGRRVEKLAI